MNVNKRKDKNIQHSTSTIYQHHRNLLLRTSKREYSQQPKTNFVTTLLNISFSFYLCISRLFFGFNKLNAKSKFLCTFSLKLNWLFKRFLKPSLAKFSLFFVYGISYLQEKNAQKGRKCTWKRSWNWVQKLNFNFIHILQYIMLIIYVEDI